MEGAKSTRYHFVTTFRAFTGIFWHKSGPFPFTSDTHGPALVFAVIPSFIRISGGWEGLALRYVVAALLGTNFVLISSP